MFPFDKSSTSDGERDRRTMEFMNLEPYTESDARRARLGRDQINQQQFAKYGDELWSLRKKMKNLAEQIRGAVTDGSHYQEQLSREKIRQAELRDPELVYEMELLGMELARREGDMKQAEKAGRRALNARSCLPQYNLEGLWLGK